MTRRRVTAILLALAMLAGAVIIAALPASAGTEIKSSPSGSFARPVEYHDFHYDQYQRPMGEWQGVSVVAGRPENTCFMQGKWGNYPNAFAQFKQTGGTKCRWGGIRLTYYYDGPGTCCDEIGVLYLDGRYCVGSTATTNAIYCTQLPDGSIFLNRNPAQGTMKIMSAEFVVCAGYVSAPAPEVWVCNHDYFEVRF